MKLLPPPIIDLISHTSVRSDNSDTSIKENIDEQQEIILELGSVSFDGVAVLTINKGVIIEAKAIFISKYAEINNLTDQPISPIEYDPIEDDIIGEETHFFDQIE